MLVILAEKSNQANDYAHALKGDMSRPNRYTIEVLNSKVLPNQPKIQVVFLQGHLYGLESPDFYKDEWKTWDIKNLPIIPDVMKFRLSKGHEMQRKAVVKAIQASSELWLGTDSDVEGENIGYLFLSQNGLLDKLTGRLWQNSLTDAGLAKAYHNIKDPAETKGNADAGYSRMIADWLIGMNYSRLATEQLRSMKYGRDGVFSVGRVQTPLLALIAARRSQRANFKPTDSFRITFTDEQGLLLKGDKETGVFANKSDSDAKLAKLSGQALHVTDVSNEHKKGSAPKLLKTGDAQSYIVKNTNLSASDALDNVLEPLYATDKIISYPRTDSNFITTDDFNQLATNLPLYKALYENIIGHDLPDELFNQPKPRKKYVDASGKKVQAAGHSALTVDSPCSFAKYKGLSDDKKLAYKFILERTLAMFADDFDFDELKVSGTADGINFAGQNKTPKPNQISWHDIIKQSEKKDDDSSLELDVDKYQNGADLNGEFSDKKETTTPPTAITESNLIAVIMPHFNFGTQATRGGIIEKLISRKLVVTSNKKDAKTNLVKKEFQPTRKGIILLELLEDSHLLDIAKVSGWESTMSDIAHGDETKEKFLNDIKETIRDEVENLPKRQFNLSIAPLPTSAVKNLDATDTGIKCPRCGKGNIAFIEMDKTDKKDENKTNHYEFYSCTKRCGFLLGNKVSNVIIDIPKLKQLLDGTLPKQKVKGGKNGEFETYFVYKKATKTKKDRIEFDFKNQKKKKK